MKGMLKTMNGPLLLPLRFGEVYMLRLVRENAFGLFRTPILTPTPGEMEHFQNLELPGNHSLLSHLN